MSSETAARTGGIPVIHGREDVKEALGLSVGSTNLAAVAGRAAVTRRSVLTLYRHRSPEVGAPSENPNLNEPGLIMTGFVDRAGDPVDIVAADGSHHRAEQLVAAALRALMHNVTPGRSTPPAVAYPAHWSPTAVDALRRALRTSPELSASTPQPALVCDAAAAFTALQSQPGLPTRGVVALCDFGGAGTSITLADAANGYQPIGATVRHLDFSGELIDQALLKHVIAGLSGAGSVDVSDTSAIGSLNRLRTQCRGAKERLSYSAVTTLAVDVPGFRGDIRLTRTELDAEIRQPLAEFIGVIRETLDRNRIHLADLVAVASVGGGANIPAVTTTLSEHLRVPVITSPRPELIAARGAAIRAARGPADESRTAVAAIAAVAPGFAAPSSEFPALAWSEEDNAPDVLAPEPCFDAPTGCSSARPPLHFVPADPLPGRSGDVAQRWYRRPAAVTGAVLAAMVLMGAGAVVALRNDATQLAGTPATTFSPAPPTPVAVPPVAERAAQAQPQPAPVSTVVIQPPTPVVHGRPIAPPPNRPALAPVARPANTPPRAATPPPTRSAPPATTSPPTITTEPPTTTTPPPPTTTPPPPSTTQPPPTTTQPPPSETPETPPPSTTQPPAAEPPPSATEPPPTTTTQAPAAPTVPTVPAVPEVTTSTPTTEPAG